MRSAKSKRWSRCCFQKTLLRFRAKKGVLPEYALIVFRHYMHSGRFKRENRITTNIGHLTQVRFVVLALLDAEAADAARLKQAILKAAFEGRLVPQDPADEPASALLARIATKSAAVRAKHGRSRKSKR